VRLVSKSSFLGFGRGLAVAVVAGSVVLAPSVANAAQLSNDAKSAIPKDVQQLIVVDYRAMQNSPAAMNLKDRVLPPELKRLETALKSSGLKVDQDADVLCFAAFRTGPSADSARILGIAQGQFQTRAILAKYDTDSDKDKAKDKDKDKDKEKGKEKIKARLVRGKVVFPMGANGFDVAFLNQTTMIFGDKKSVDAALDAYDGLAQNFLANSDMVNEMGAVDSKAVWSLLDAKGTQTMMRSVLGDAAQLTDYDTVRDRMKSSRYTMDFSNGVKFDMAVVLSDTLTGATAATLMKGVALLRKTQGTPLEKQALDATTIDSNSGTLTVSYSSTDSQFSSLLGSPLFQSVVK
jgi:hypothetical protein